MIEHKYSGDLSNGFWQIVSIVDDEDLSLYQLGVQLQNLEDKVLAKLNHRVSFIQDLKSRASKRVRQKK